MCSGSHHLCKGKSDADARAGRPSSALSSPARWSHHDLANAHAQCTCVVQADHRQQRHHQWSRHDLCHAKINYKRCRPHVSSNPTCVNNKSPSKRGNPSNKGFPYNNEVLSFVSRTGKNNLDQSLLLSKFIHSDLIGV